MIELFNLGKYYVSDFLKPGEKPRHEPVEMKVMMNNDGVVMLENAAPREVMWGEVYWYRSGLNITMRNQLADVVSSVLKVIQKKENQLWVDLASNDGYLLSCVPDNFIKVGIDPVGGDIKKDCEKVADLVIQDYFKYEIFKKSDCGNRKANVISVISMFYDISEPELFLKDVSEILDDDGLLVLQLSFSPLMILQMAYDNFCHEHLRYYSLFNLKSLLERENFIVLDCQLNDTNSGSFRLFIMKKCANLNLFGNAPYRDVCNFRIESILSYERTLGMDSIYTWHKFYDDIKNLKGETVSFIMKEKYNGKRFMCYGASTKGNSTLQMFGMNKDIIDAIADKNTDKHGLITVGSQIPIISEEEMRERNPDYLWVLPFHFISEFMEREKEYLLKGGKMIVCSPKFRVITKEDL